MRQSGQIDRSNPSGESPENGPDRCENSATAATTGGESVAGQLSPAVFWSKVDRNGPIPAHRPELGPCWLWTGAHVGCGYGRCLPIAGKTTYSHRFSYELNVGPIEPPSLFVLHRCDNPPCVNPTHLFLGTQADNMADKLAKGRFGGAVPAPRAITVFGETFLSLGACAKKYGIKQECLSRRLARGLSPERAVTEPDGRGRRSPLASTPRPESSPSQTPQPRSA